MEAQPLEAVPLEVWTPPEKTPPSNPDLIGTQHRGMKTRLTNLLERTDLLDIVCNHVSSGGTLLDLCSTWRIAFSSVMNWIHDNEDRQMRYDRAMLDRQEWVKARILKELTGMAFSDIRDMYNERGELLAVRDMPDDVARSVASIETEEVFDVENGKKVYVGTTRKVKRWDRIKAIEMLGTEFGMFRKIVGVGAVKDVEALVAGSWASSGRKALPPGETTEASPPAASADAAGADAAQVSPVGLVTPVPSTTASPPATI